MSKFYFTKSKVREKTKFITNVYEYSSEFFKEVKYIVMREGSVSTAT